MVPKYVPQQVRKNIQEANQGNTQKKKRERKQKPFSLTQQNPEEDEVIISKTVPPSPAINFVQQPASAQTVPQSPALNLMYASVNLSQNDQVTESQPKFGNQQETPHDQIQQASNQQHQATQDLDFDEQRVPIVNPMALDRSPHTQISSSHQATPTNPLIQPSVFQNQAQSVAMQLERENRLAHEMVSAFMIQMKDRQVNYLLDLMNKM